MPLPFVFLLPAAKAVAASAVTALPATLKTVQTARRIAGYAESFTDATQPEESMSRDYALKSDVPSKGATTTAIVLASVAGGLLLLGGGSGALPLLGGGRHGHSHTALLEAEVAALKVEVQKNAEMEAMRADYERQLIKAYVKGETCHFVRGRVYTSLRDVADNYDSEPRYIDSHTHHRGCGCGSTSGGAPTQEG